MVLLSDRGTPKIVRPLNKYSGHIWKLAKAVSIIYLKAKGSLLTY